LTGRPVRAAISPGRSTLCGMRRSGAFFPLSLPVLVVLGLALAIMTGLLQLGTLEIGRAHV